MADLILYDGTCGLCARITRFVLARDTADRFRFASQQSQIARAILTRYGSDPDELATIYVVVDYSFQSERLLSRGQAVIHVLQAMSCQWQLLAIALRFLPGTWVNWGYRLVAQNRYRLFGRNDVCVMPSPRDRTKLLG